MKVKSIHRRLPVICPMPEETDLRELSCRLNEFINNSDFFCRALSRSLTGMEIAFCHHCGSESAFRDQSSHHHSYRELSVGVLLVLLAERIGVPLQRYLEVTAPVQESPQIKIGKSGNA